MSSIHAPPSYPPRAKPPAQSPSPSPPIHAIGWVVGGIMIFNGLSSMANEKSAIHQIYTTLNNGFSAQLVLMGFAIKESSK